MEKKDLVNILNEILSPIGFKKKGNYWLMNNDEINKMVNLQKSQFSNSYYINYGYVLKSVPLTDIMMHVYNRVSSIDSIQNERIKKLLNLENDIPDEDREKELKELIVSELVFNVDRINTENDLLSELKKRAHLNDIPLVVKRHFNLE